MNHQDDAQGMQEYAMRKFALGKGFCIFSLTLIQFSDHNSKKNIRISISMYMQSDLQIIIFVGKKLKERSQSFSIG